MDKLPLLYPIPFQNGPPGTLVILIAGQHDPGKPEIPGMLQDMVVAAVNEAMRAAEADAADSMGRITGGLNLGL